MQFIIIYVLIRLYFFKRSFFKVQYNDWSKHIFGLDENQDLKVLLDECKLKFSEFDQDKISHAFSFCTLAHKDQLRLSGEPYYCHPLEVARIIINELPLDDTSVVAALLHDVCDNSSYTVSFIRQEFGDTVANIINGITQIQLIESYNVRNSDNYRKMILSWFGDVRIILIKIADRLHNLRTADFLMPEKRKKLANETMEIYAPFAHLFGLGSFKWELEDLSFRILQPDEYHMITKAIQLTREERKDYIKQFIKPINYCLDSMESLNRNKVTYEISGRPKHIYSIYNKTILREKPIEELFDLFAIRIILNTDYENLCYEVCKQIAHIYKPISGTFKDYIVDPKRNGYQSLHLAVQGIDNRPVEVQIRTKSMHEYAENGLAAHFRYKPGAVESDSILQRTNVEEWVDNVKSIFENHYANGNTSSASVVKGLPIDSISVFTHSNNYLELPLNATTLDFAYAIHTDIGNTCIGAKVNGKIVPLDYRLKNGDKVEILNSKQAKPNEQWLEYVVTVKARKSIIQSLQHEQKKYLSIGIDAWVNMQKNFNVIVTEDDFKLLVKQLKYKDEKAFFSALGKKDIDFNFIYQQLYKQHNKKSGRESMYAESEVSESLKSILQYHQKNLILADCCSPIPGV